MVVELPLQSSLTYYSFEVDLDERPFRLDVRWNQRAEGYFLDIYDGDGNVILAGRRIHGVGPLLSRFRDPALPEGEIICVDQSQAQTWEDPALGELGARVTLLYFPIADMPSIWKS